MKKIFVWMLVIVTILEFSICFHYDNVLNAKENSTSSSTGNSIKNIFSTTKTSDDLKLIADGKVKLIAISDNKKYVAFAGDNNKLHIVDLDNNSEVYSDDEKDTLVYLKWIRNDSLFIGVKTKDTEIEVKTFQIGSKKERVIKTFDGVTSTSTVKSITYSPFTNDVYILVGNKSVTKMYHFDTNGNMNYFPLNSDFISHPMMLSTKNDLFYEDNNHNIWLYSNGSFNTIRQNAVLLSVVEDTMYYGILNDSGKVESVCEYKVNEKEKLFDLNTPASADHILIKNDGDVIVANKSSYYDKTTGKSNSLPQGYKLLSDNHSFFILSDDKTYLLDPK